MKKESNYKKINTDMNKVKVVLKKMIDIEIIAFSKEFEMYIHPFTASKIVSIYKNGTYYPLNLNENDNMRLWKENLIQQFENIKQLDEVFDYLETNYFTLYLLSQLYKNECISAIDMGKVLKNKYRYLFDEEPYMLTHQDVVDIFKYADKTSLMDNKSLDFYHNLPERMTIYRAIEDRSYSQPFIWLQSKQEAIDTQIFHDYNQQVEIWQLNVEKEDILAVWLDDLQGNIMIVNITEDLMKKIIVNVYDKI